MWKCILIVLLSVAGGCAVQPSLSQSLRGGVQADGGDGLAAALRKEPSVRQVAPWDNPYGQGLVVDTAHYRIYTTHLEPLTLRQTPAFLESAFRAYQSQLSTQPANTEPFVVYLFGTRSQWEAFTRQLTGDEAAVYLNIQAGAYVVNGICVAYDIGRRQTFSVLGHEGWHQFNQRLFVYRLPSWLDEGIATLFETCRYERGRFLFDPTQNRMRLGMLKETLQAGRPIPLEQLIVLDPGQVLGVYGGDVDRTAAFYAQVYALVRFLREERYGLRLRPYQQMLQGAAGGNWPLEADLLAVAADRRIPLTVGWNTRTSHQLFIHYFGDDIDTLDAEYQNYCRKITYPVQIAP